MLYSFKRQKAKKWTQDDLKTENNSKEKPINQECYAVFFLFFFFKKGINLPENFGEG